MTVSRPTFLFPISQFIPSCTKHLVFTNTCHLCESRPMSFHSLMRNFFQTANNLVFSQLHAACVSRPILSYSFSHNLFSKSGRHCNFTGGCRMSLSSHCFLFPNSQLIRFMWFCQWIMFFVLRGFFFFLSLIRSCLKLFRLQNSLARPRQTN